MHYLMVAAVAVFLASSAAQADMNAALKAYDAGDYAAALTALQPLAEADDAEAQYRLGMIYDGGKGVEADPKTALGWFRKAAAGGARRSDAGRRHLLRGRQDRF